MATIQFENMTRQVSNFHRGVLSGLSRIFRCQFEHCDFDGPPSWNIPNWLAEVSFVYIRKSQAIAEIWHFRKRLSNCRNFFAVPWFSRHWSQESGDVVLFPRIWDKRLKKFLLCRANLTLFVTVIVCAIITNISWNIVDQWFSTFFKSRNLFIVIKLSILLRNLSVQNSTIQSIFKEPPGVIGGTSGFRGTQVEKHSGRWWERNKPILLVWYALIIN